MSCCGSSWRTFPSSGFDLGLIGFGEGELERLLAGGKEGLTEDDEAPALPEQAVTQPGDLWMLGEHRLLCGDATVLADVERVLDGQLADMTFTDPPYNVDYAQLDRRTSCGASTRPILNDNLGNGFEAFLLDACANVLCVTKGACYVCMSSSELHTLQRAFTAAGGKWSTFVIWAKHTFTLGRADYQRQYRTDPVWLACGARPLLVRRAGSRRRLVLRQAGEERSPSHPEAGRADRAGDPQLEQEPRHRARSVRRLGLDPHRVREDRTPGAAGGAGPEILRCDRAALAGLGGRQSRFWTATGEATTRLPRLAEATAQPESLLWLPGHRASVLAMTLASCGSMANRRTLYAQLDTIVRLALGRGDPVADHLHEIEQVHPRHAGWPVVLRVVGVALVVMLQGWRRLLDDRLVFRRTIGHAGQQRVDLIKGGLLRLVELAGVVDAASRQQFGDEHVDVVAHPMDMGQRIRSGCR